MKNLLFLLFIISLDAFTQNEVQVKQVYHDYQMNKILSASGIEIIDGKTYIVSDNQNVLFIKSGTSIKYLAINKSDNDEKIHKGVKKRF